MEERLTSRLAEKQCLVLQNKKNELLSQLEMNQLYVTSQTLDVQNEKERRDRHATSWEAGNCLPVSPLRSRTVHIKKILQKQTGRKS